MATQTLDEYWRLRAKMSRDKAHVLLEEARKHDEEAERAAAQCEYLEMLGHASKGDD